jgi:hypothetical protein
MYLSIIIFEQGSPLVYPLAGGEQKITRCGRRAAGRALPRRWASLCASEEALRSSHGRRGGNW